MNEVTYDNTKSHEQMVRRLACRKNCQLIKPRSSNDWNWSKEHPYCLARNGKSLIYNAKLEDVEKQLEMI